MDNPYAILELAEKRIQANISNINDLLLDIPQIFAEASRICLESADKHEARLKELEEQL